MRCPHCNRDDNVPGECDKCYLHGGWKRMIYTDPYNDSWFPSKSRWVSIHYAEVISPRIISIPNRYPIPLKDYWMWDEKQIGGKWIQVECYRADNVCVDPGDNIDPPVYEPDIYETLIVRPTIKCWGKGLI